MSESTGNLLARSDTRALMYKASTGALIYGIHYSYVNINSDATWRASDSDYYTWWDPQPESVVQAWADSVFDPSSQSWSSSSQSCRMELARGANYSSTASWRVSVRRFQMPAGATKIIRINSYTAVRATGSGGYPAIAVECSDSASPPKSVSGAWNASCMRVTLGSSIGMDVDIPVDNTKAYIYVFYIFDDHDYPDWGAGPSYLSHSSTIRVAIGG